jgi:hypothetical protein
VAIWALAWLVYTCVVPRVRRLCCTQAPKGLWHIERSIDGSVVAKPTPLGESGGYVGARVTPTKRWGGINLSNRLVRSHLHLVTESVTPLPKLDCNASMPSKSGSAAAMLFGMGSAQALPLPPMKPPPRSMSPIAARLAARPPTLLV